MINNWSEDNLYWDSDLETIIQKLEQWFKNKIYEIAKHKKYHEKLLLKNEEKLKYLNESRDKVITNEIFKIIDRNIESKHFNKVKAVDKASDGKLFPEVIEFKSEFEFETAQRKKDTYIFIVKPNDFIPSLEHDIAGTKLKMEEIEISFKNLKEEIKHNLTCELNNYIQELENNRNQVVREYVIIVKKKQELKMKLKTLQEEINQQNKELEIELEKKKNQDKTHIMNSEKGKYSYNWLHRRKSWDVAQKPIYLDFGDGKLFKIISNQELFKYYASDFLQMVQK